MPSGINESGKISPVSQLRTQINKDLIVPLSLKDDTPTYDAIAYALSVIFPRKVDGFTAPLFDKVPADHTIAQVILGDSVRSGIAVANTFNNLQASDLSDISTETFIKFDESSKKFSGPLAEVVESHFSTSTITTLALGKA